jgi:hypothetical protein
MRTLDTKVTGYSRDMMNPTHEQTLEQDGIYLDLVDFKWLPRASHAGSSGQSF